MTALATRSKPRHFFDLGFRADDGRDQPPEAAAERGGQPPLMLGKKKSTLTWELAAWGAVAAGMFSRQGLELPSLVWKLANVNPGAALASLVVGLAVFPMMMRWINRRRRRASLEHVALPFAFGFFLDMAVVAAVKIPESITSRI